MINIKLGKIGSPLIGLTNIKIMNNLSDEIHITLNLKRDKDFDEQMDEICAYCIEEKIQIIYGFSFGNITRYPEVMKYFIERGIELFPLTWVAGNNMDYETDGVYLFGIKNKLIQRITEGKEVIGSLYEDEYASYLYLGNMVSGINDNMEIIQTESVFRKIDTYLNACGMNMKNIVRTWFYNNNILSWYNGFNNVRTKFYNENDIFNNLLPASTGICGSNYHNSALIASIMAIKPKNGILIEEVKSPLQNSATEYGSSFSRAVKIKTAVSEKITISGTASIDEKGITIYKDDISKQIKYTMDIIRKFLDQNGMGENEIVRAFAYIKDASYEKEFKEFLLKNSLNMIPLIIVNATICREDLLFEFELDAVKYL